MGDPKPLFFQKAGTEATAEHAREKSEGQVTPSG
jgi:hypothetical protein